MDSLNDILVSIIIPVYNVEKYLHRCVKSVLNQTHNNVEIILVDDGSEDDSSVICDEYSKIDSRVKVIHQENQGQSAARNAGIDVSNGEWLCFVDSDDFVDPCFVEGLLEAAVTNGCLSARCKRKIAYSDFISEKQPKKEFKVFNFFEYAVFLDNTPGYALYTVWTGIYHKSLFQNIRFPNIGHTEDGVVSTQVIWNARDWKFAVTNQTLYYYYQSPSSIVRGKTSLNVLNRYIAYDWIFKFWLDNGEPKMIDIYFKTYFTSLVLDYTKLCRDMPDEKKEYLHLLARIGDNVEKAKLMNLKVVVLPPLSQKIWETIENNNFQYILYGFNNRTIELIQWLNYFNVDLLEIWDEDTSQNERYIGVDIPVTRPNSDHEQKQNIFIIICVEDIKTSLIIERSLSKMGYSNFISYDNIFGAIKYVKYKKFLPSLLSELNNKS